MLDALRRGRIACVLPLAAGLCLAARASGATLTGVVRDNVGIGVANANIDAIESDLEGTSDNPPLSNDRLFLPATKFNRFAVTREINDGLLAPRFAPSQRAWVQAGSQVTVSPPVQASAGRDGDDR